KATQVVFVRSVIAMPGDDIKRTVVDLTTPQIAAKFCNLFKLAFAIFEPCDRRFEIARICQTICTDRAEGRKLKMSSVIFADVASHSCLSVLIAFYHRRHRYFYTKLQTSWNAADFAR